MLSFLLGVALISLSKAAMYRVTVSSSPYDQLKSNTDHLNIKYASDESDPSNTACTIYADFNKAGIIGSCYFLTDDKITALSIGIDASDLFGFVAIELFSYGPKRVLFSQSRETVEESWWSALSLGTSHARYQVFLLSLLDGSGHPDEATNSYLVEIEVAKSSDSGSESAVIPVLYTDHQGTRRDGCEIHSGADTGFKVGEVQACEFATAYPVAGFTFDASSIDDVLRLGRFTIFDVTDPQNTVRLLSWFPANEATRQGNSHNYLSLDKDNSPYIRFDVVTY